MRAPGYGSYMTQEEMTMSYHPVGATACPAPLVYNSFYDSCVNPCPKGQDYDANGICAPSADYTPFIIGGAVLLGLLYFSKKGRR